MTKTVPDLAEIEATVERLETRYCDKPTFSAYERVRQRFEADLEDRRDLALAKSAALMLVKELAGNN